MSWLNACLVGIVWVLIFSISEDWWVGTALTYFPRWPWAIPSIILLFASLFILRKYAMLNVISTAIVLGPISQFQLQLTNDVHDGGSTLELNVITCNVQGFRPDFSETMRELLRLSPDIIALQEAHADDEHLQKHFSEWHIVHVGEFWIGSKYPLRLIDECHSLAFDRRTAICVGVKTPRGEFRLVNLHQMTARRALTELTGDGIPSGTGPERVERQAALRDEEARETRYFVERCTEGMPTLLAGDFNMPTSSSIYREYWNDYCNAFDECGSGYGYTSPCSRFWWWPLETPWLRIDHLLGSSHWRATSSRVGLSSGSDHRLVFARWSLNSDSLSSSTR